MGKLSLRQRRMLDLIASLVVDLSEQKLTAFDANQQVLRVIPVSTGKASTPTPLGHSQVFTKYRSTTMVGRAYTVPNVPYTMCVTANEAICLHAAPWQERAGQPFGVPRSHGCVRMPMNDARWLFDHTRRGTPITIQA